MVDLMVFGIFVVVIVIPIIIFCVYAFVAFFGCVVNLIKHFDKPKQKCKIYDREKENWKLQKEREIFYKTCEYPNERKLNNLLFEQSKNFKMSRTSGPPETETQSLFTINLHSNLDYIFFTDMKNDKIEIVCEEYECVGFMGFISYVKSINIKTNNSVFLVYAFPGQDYISGPWDDDIDVLINDGYKNLLKRKIENCLEDIEKEKNYKLEQIAKETARLSAIKNYIVDDSR